MYEKSIKQIYEELEAAGLKIAERDGSWAESRSWWTGDEAESVDAWAGKALRVKWNAGRPMKVKKESDGIFVSVQHPEK